MAAAEILTGLICDGGHADAAIFDPTAAEQQRADKIASEGAHAVRGLAHRLFHGESPLPEELPVGHGGPALVDGKQMGVYRASETEYYAVELRCPDAAEADAEKQRLIALLKGETEGVCQKT